MNKINSYELQTKIMRKWLQLQFGLANSSRANRMYNVLGEVGAELEAR